MILALNHNSKRFRMPGIFTGNREVELAIVHTTGTFQSLNPHMGLIRQTFVELFGLFRGKGDCESLIFRDETGHAHVPGRLHVFRELMLGRDNLKDVLRIFGRSHSQVDTRVLVLHGLHYGSVHI